MKKYTGSLRDWRLR
jgi:serine/threonine protein kinase